MEKVLSTEELALKYDREFKKLDNRFSIKSKPSVVEKLH